MHTGTSASRIAPAFRDEPSRVSGVRIWVMAARVRTLPAAVAPVLVGTSLALGADHFHPLAFVAALLGVACGVYLVAVAGWELLAVGGASILAGVLYTGGPRPYGYEGLGELFVFLFFGVVAVAGSFFVQVRHLHWEAFALSVPVGLLAAAILLVNNIRDIDSDRRASKRTLAVKLGRTTTRWLFAGVVYLAFLLAPVTWIFGPVKPWVMLTWLALPLAAALVRIVRTRTDGPSLNGALARSGMLQLAFCVLLSAGLLLSR